MAELLLDTSRIPYGPDDIVPPTKYRLIRRIGRGGMAEVWEAQNTFMDRIDAIKIVLPRVARAGHYTAQQVAKEARIPNGLRQRARRNVVDVLDAGITSDHRLPYIVMELLRGCSLRERLTKRAAAKQPFEVRDIVAIAYEMVHPLAYAHQVQIVHLDMKPENVFLAREYEQGQETVTVKIFDFGISKLLFEGDVGTFNFHGTARYAAPEQFSPAYGQIGTWTDTYSCGHIMYELAAGHPSFEPNGIRLDRVALEDAQLSAEPTDIRELRRDLPPMLADLISRCLRKEPHARPQTATELAKALSELDETLRGKRPLVSLPAISDFDLPLDALAFNTTTHRSPDPAPLVSPVAEPAQVVRGPSFAPPNSVTDVPDAPATAANDSEDFLSEASPDAAGDAYKTDVDQALPLFALRAESDEQPRTAAEPTAQPTALTPSPVLVIGKVAEPLSVDENIAQPASLPKEPEPFEDKVYAASPFDVDSQRAVRVARPSTAALSERDAAPTFSSSSFEPVTRVDLDDSQLIALPHPRRRRTALAVAASIAAAALGVAAAASMTRVGSPVSGRATSAASSSPATSGVASVEAGAMRAAAPPEPRSLPEASVEADDRARGSVLHAALPVPSERASGGSPPPVLHRSLVSPPVATSSAAATPSTSTTVAPPSRSPRRDDMFRSIEPPRD